MIKTIGLRAPLCELVAEYLVTLGYDSEELAGLGTKRAVKFIEFMSLSLPDPKDVEEDLKKNQQS